MTPMSDEKHTKEHETFNSALKTARAKLEELLRERQSIDRQIIGYQRTVDSLSEVLEKGHEGELAPNILPLPDLETSQSVGFTDAVRSVLREKGTAMGPTSIRDALIASGVNMDKYSSQMVVVHNTLKRLCESGEVERMPIGDSGAFKYVWVGPVGRALKRERPSLLNIARRLAVEKS